MLLRLYQEEVEHCIFLRVYDQKGMLIKDGNHGDTLEGRGTFIKRFSVHICTAFSKVETLLQASITWS